MNSTDRNDYYIDRGKLGLIYLGSDFGEFPKEVVETTTEFDFRAKVFSRCFLGKGVSDGTNWPWDSPTSKPNNVFLFRYRPRWKFWMYGEGQVWIKLEDHTKAQDIHLAHFDKWKNVKDTWNYDNQFLSRDAKVIRLPSLLNYLLKFPLAGDFDFHRIFKHKTPILYGRSDDTKG